MINKLIRKSLIAAVMLLPVLLAACSSGRSELELALMSPSMAPRPALFLTGPMAGLLTNASSYSATVALEYGGSSNRVELAKGKLLNRGSLLLYAPEAGEDMTKQTKEAGISFIWNTTDNSGFIVSESMQGFAPMSLGSHVTNLVAKSAASSQEKIESQVCDRREYEAQASDGSRLTVVAWEAKELDSLPLRLVQQGSGRPLELRLSNVRLEKLPEGLFRPPDGFKQYPTPESLMTELAMRKQRLKESR